MQPVIYYEGERIYFRPIEVEDAAVLQRWVNDPRVWSTLGFRPPLNAHCERKWIEERKRNDSSDYIFGIVARDSDQLVGTTGLHNVSPVDRKAIFGIMIGEVAAQNRGYGSEAVRLTLRFAFEELNLNRVELSVGDFNARAIHVYEAAGFELEGRFRQSFYRHGAYHDDLRYAALRENWASSRPRPPEAAHCNAPASTPAANELSINVRGA